MSPSLQPLAQLYVGQKLCGILCFFFLTMITGSAGKATET